MKPSTCLLVVLLLATACKREKARGSLAEQEKERQAIVVPDLTEPQYAPPEVRAAEAAAAAPAEPSPEAIRKLHEEAIAGVNLGMTEAEVMKALGKPAKKSAIAPIGNAKDEIGMTWTWPTMTAKFGSAPKNGTFTLREITFAAASKVKTARGVGIGSTRPEIIAAYPGLADPIFAKDIRLFVLGNSQNGVTFYFREEREEGDLEKDRVRSIEWVGGAEK